MSGEHLSDLVLDAVRIGVASPDVDRDAHLATCPECQDRRRALEGEAAAFAKEFRPEVLAADALARAAERRTPWWRSFRIPAFAAAAAATAAVAAAILLAPPPPENARTKGTAPLLEVYLLEGTTRIPLAAAIPADARLAVRVSPESPTHVRLLWSDTPGTWTALYPEQTAAPWRLSAPAWLDREVVLDGAHQDEELAAIACTHPVDHAAAARMLLDDTPREDCQLARTRITKR